MENVVPNTSDKHLRSRAMQAGAWFVGLRIIQQVINLVRPLILARLLAPEDFGVIGIVFMTRIFVERLGISSGLYDALIRRDDLTREHYAAAWTFEAGRALLFGIVVVISAPLVADFFNAPVATPILQIAGLEIFLSSLNSIGIILVRKELQFKKEFVHKLVPTVVGTAITIWLAFELRNVWALALGQLTITVMTLVMSYVVAPYFVRPTWHWEKLKDLAGFAFWSSFASLLSVVSSQTDRFFVARILGPTSLGIYVIAGRFTNLISMELTTAVRRVGFPAFSKAQYRDDAFNKAFSQVISITIYVLGPLALYLTVWAPEMIEVLLGPKWADAVPVMRVLAGASVLFALANVYGTVIVSRGRAQLTAVATGLKFVVMASTAYPLITVFGVEGAGLTVAAGSAAELAFLYWRSNDVMQLSLFSLVKSLVAAVLLSGGLSIAPVLRDADTLSVFEVFILGIIVFGGWFVLGSVLLSRYFQYGPARLVAEMRSRGGKKARVESGEPVL